MLIKRTVAGVRLLGNAATLAGASLIALFASLGTASPAGGPFDGLQGVWGGSGTVTYSSGTKEKLRCRVQYVTANDNNLTQALRCASDSYRFQINAIFVHSNGTITGRWSELSMDISGTVTGSASAGRIAGKLHGPGFLADINVETDGNEQTVVIAASGQEIERVSVAVRKSSN